MLPCREGRIRAAGLDEWEPGSDDSLRVWQVTLAPTTALRAVPLGTVPEGARVDTAFVDGFRPGYRYKALLDVDGDGMGTGEVFFGPDDLRSGPKVIFDGRRFTEEAFAKEARRVCQANG